MLDMPESVVRRIDAIVAQMPGLPPGLSIDARYEVPEALTARHWFETLPHGAGYARRLMPVMATGALVAVAESVCAQALQPYLAPGDTVVGTKVEIEHTSPAPAGTELRLQARVVDVRDRGRQVHFDVDAKARDRLVCSVRVVLRAVDAVRFGARLAALRP
jgi:predicted thioesterase